MTDDFYRAFEDKHRGSRELIKSRLRVYLPFVEPLREVYPDCRAVDLGCGRGEWLELMKEVGIDAHGIDLDDGMLTGCHERGLSVEQGDAIAYLRGLADDSVVIVSAFHVVEHIPFGALQTLVQEALRVLVPAGLLILETPNPENLSVGACKFYYDPTHQRPIPPQLLSFLPEHYGFARTKVLRLQEPLEIASASVVTLLDVLSSVSPDYAVVAQKAAAGAAQLAMLDLAFRREYGAQFEVLASRFQARIDDLSQVQGQLSQTQGQLSQTQGQLSQTQGQLSQTQGQLSQTQGQLSQTQGQLAQAQRELADAYASTSWRVTAPLRSVALGARAIARAPSKVLLRLKIWLKPHTVRVVTNPSMKQLIERSGRWLIAHPGLSGPIRRFLRRHDRLRSRLRWLVLGVSSPAVTSQSSHASPAEGSPLSDLTPRAERIYQDLLAAIEARKGAS